MKAFTIILLGFSLLMGVSIVLAEPVTELRNCAKLDRDLKRLACFDEAVKGLTGQITITTTSSMTIPAEGTTKATVPGFETIPARVNVQPIDSFGLQNKLANEEPDEVHSIIEGAFTGWSGKTEFILKNGQIWKQVDPTRKMKFKATNPKITIRKAVFGSYRLKVEGLNTTVTVRRIK